MDCKHETTEFRRQRWGSGDTLWKKAKQCLYCGRRLSHTYADPFWPEDYKNEAIDLPPYDYKFDIRSEGHEIISEDHQLKKPCKVCNARIGFVYINNGQNVAPESRKTNQNRNNEKKATREIIGSRWCKMSDLWQNWQ